MPRSHLHGAVQSWWHACAHLLRAGSAPARRAAPCSVLPRASPPQAFNASTLSCERSQGNALSQVLQRGRQLHVSLHSAADEASAHPPKNVSRRGPQPHFQAQLDAGTLRSDPRQVAAIGLLQDVYIQLQKLYPRIKKPSNLTMVSNVSTKSNHDAWCVHRCKPAYQCMSKGAHKMGTGYPSGFSGFA